MKSWLNRGFILLALCGVFAADGWSEQATVKQATVKQAKVQWVGTDNEEITFTALVDARLAKECFDAGLELEHRFLVKLCERVNRFGTVCGELRKEVHNISYDPIQEGYRVIKDRLGDVEDPIGVTITDLDEALSSIATVERYPLAFLKAEDGQSPTTEEERVRHLGLRVRTTCKGAMSETLVDLSYFLSFGLIDLYGFDSGWSFYELRTDLPVATDDGEVASELPRKSS